MTKEQYLIARGWRKVENKELWYNSHFQNIDFENAICIQLNRDAELRDFVDLHRPIIKNL